MPKVKDTRQPDGSRTQEPTMLQNLGAIVAGLVAARIATYAVTAVWRLATREEPPQIDQRVPVGKKALWLGLMGGFTGAARQAARDLVKPPTEGPA